MSQTHSSGISLPTLLGVVFITLKLTGHIAWSWWWVLAPFWIGLLVFGLVLGVFLMLAILAS